MVLSITVTDEDTTQLSIEFQPNSRFLCFLEMPGGSGWKLIQNLTSKTFQLQGKYYVSKFKGSVWGCDGRSDEHDYELYSRNRFNGNGWLLYHHEILHKYKQ